MQTYPMAVITEPLKIGFEDQQLIALAPDEVRIRVRYAAICGSDLHLFKGKHPSAPLPSAVGHELSGEITEVGANVSHLSVGDRVTVEPVITCGACHFCLRGQYHLCREISFHYRKGQGAFGTYFTAPARHVFKLPETLSLEAGALIEPLSVALHAVNKTNARMGQSSAIFGAGAIGLLTLMLLKRITQALTICVDVNPFRLQTARDLGACVAINNMEEDAVTRINQLTDGLGVNISVEAVGRAQTLTQALESVQKGGLVALIGIFEEPRLEIPVNLFIQKEITLAGSQGYNWDFQDALSMLSHSNLPLENLVTHQFPLGKLQEAFNLLTTPNNQAVKVLIEM